MAFSVLMSVYRNDNPEFVRRAIDSVTTSQTVSPSEVVIVQDGPVDNSLNKLIRDYELSAENIFKIIRLPENKGLGNALRIGVEASSNEIIARMDSDDVSNPYRFEKQIAFIETHPECDIVGGQISEFIGDEENIVGYRVVPCSNKDIYLALKHRCPFNHMSVAFRRSAVMHAGNYQDWHYNEDYYLWIRMGIAKCTFANLPETLVNVRIGKKMYARRGGYKYFISEAKLQKYMHKYDLISFPRYFYNVLGRFVVQVVMPNNARGWFYRIFARK